MSILALGTLSKVGISLIVGLVLLLIGIKLNKRYVLWQKMQCLFYRLFGTYYNCNCGHRAKWKTMLTIDGHSGAFTLGNGPHKYCPKCWAEAAIKCAWCGKTILPGDPITLYHANPGFVVPPYAVEYGEPDEGESHGAFVGCLRSTCACGVDRAGFWVMPGKVQRVLSPLEMCMVGARDGNCNVVIVGDISDIREAIPIPDKVERPSE